jgi:hypothetical protein
MIKLSLNGSPMPQSCVLRLVELLLKVKNLSDIALFDMIPIEIALLI